MANRAWDPNGFAGCDFTESIRFRLEKRQETGIVGLTSLVIVIVVMFASYLRIYATFRTPAVLAAIAVAAGYWGSGLFNFSFWSVWWQCSFVLMLVLCLAAREHEHLV